MPLEGLVPVKVRKIPPMMSTGVLVTVFRPVATGRSCSRLILRVRRRVSGTTVSWLPVSAHDCWARILVGLSDELGTGNLREA